MGRVEAETIMLGKERLVGCVWEEGRQQAGGGNCTGKDPEAGEKWSLRDTVPCTT